MDDEGYPDTDPISLIEKKSILDSTDGSDYPNGGPPFSGFDQKDGKEEEKNYDDTGLEMDDLKQGLPFEDYDQKKVTEEEEKDDGDGPEKADPYNDKAEDNQEDYSYLADLEARAHVKFNQIVFLKEFLYHTFWPLSAPLMYYLDGGWFGLINRGFLGWDSPALVLTQLFWAINCPYFRDLRGFNSYPKFIKTRFLAAVYLLNVVSLTYMVVDNDTEFVYDVLMVDLLWCMRNLVIATKYAFLSKIEMEEMRTKRVPPYVHQYRTSGFLTATLSASYIWLWDRSKLLAAWKDPIPRRVLKYELLLSAMRNKLILKKYSFKVDTDVDSHQAMRDLVLDLRLAAKNDFNSLSFSYGKRADRWLEIGCGELATDPLQWAEAGGVADLELPSRLYAAHVIRQASSLSRLRRLGHTLLSQHLRPCACVLGVLHAILPIAGRYILGGHRIPGPPWTKYCVLIPTFVLITFAMISNLGFMMIGVLDFRRRHYIAQSLDEVLRNGVYTGTEFVRTSSMKYQSSSKWVSIIPGMLGSRLRSESDELSRRSGSSGGSLSGEGIFFDFSEKNSLLAWWACRLLMSNFGYGFLKRIKYYTTYFAGYCVLLLVFLVVKMLTGIKKKDLYLLITVIFSIHIFLTLLALMVWPGGDANYMLQQHGTTLIRRKIRTQMKMIKDGVHLLPEENLRKARATIDTINSIADGIKWDNQKVKLSICGFEARDQLVSLIVAVVTASLSIGIGQLVQNGLVTSG